VAACTVTLIVSCVTCAAFRGMILSGSLERLNIAVGAAQYNVQYWCLSCDEVLVYTISDCSVCSRKCQCLSYAL
jgi:hypothetical protein